MSKLALGTAQFGLNYGINNQNGKVSRKEVRDILLEAESGGIKTIDTAFAYGESESVLGEILNLHWNVDIISKLPVDLNGTSIEECLLESLSKLRKNKLYGYLVHNFLSWEKDHNIFDVLQNLKKEGKIEKIGISLYSPNELFDLWKQGIELDLVQIPFNILDQRFSPYLFEMQQRNIEVHTRSAFLQGLFFKSEKELSRFFDPIKIVLKKLKELSKAYEVSIVELCLGFCLLHEGISKVVVGVDNKENLLQNMLVEKSVDKLDSLLDELTSFALTKSTQILNPSMWKI